MLHKTLISLAFAMLGAFVLLAFLPGLANAQLDENAANVAAPQTSTLDIPVKTAADDAVFDNDEITDPPLRLTQDKSAIVSLNGSAGSIIVGNPAHLNILADSANRLIVVPRAPGASFFTVLDKDGKLLMQRHVIVGSPKEKYIRIRRVCPAGNPGCQNTSTYYCPDMCHSIMNTSDAGESSGSLAIESSGGGVGSGQNRAEPEAQAPLTPEETDISSENQ